MTTAVNYDTVTTAASDVRRTASELTSELTDLMGRVKRVAENWDGQAKDAYHDRQADLTAQMDGMNQDLARIASLLDAAVVGYQDTDRGNAARFRMSMG
ncbi:WXG100 family type VII secretion target [Streptomyces sp. NBC_01497]|uniref:WXG100 family type VII secretion target n=1 Tax=Streptomyces sp. NBC_01497 TaxID=2903885 RepID=UPI002E34169E|nr:WXG100 family type VII secretion target [Streptomyces sp. NBC_01497]